MQTKPTLSWDDIRLFLAVLREGSLSAAAQRLEVDVSTASRRLVRLEESLHASLFIRTRDGAAPTSRAEQLLEHAEMMESSVLAFQKQAQGFERAVEGVVRVTAPPGLLDVFVMPALGTLFQKHPLLRLEIDSQMAMVNLTRQEADVALRTLQPVGANLIAKRLVATRSVLAGSAKYVQSLKKISHLSQCRFIGGTAQLSALPSSRWIERHVPNENIVLRANSFPTQMAAASAGLGLVLAPLPYVKTLKLCEPKITSSIQESLGALGEDKLWLVTHTALRHVPRIDAVWNFLDTLFHGQ